MRLTNKLRIVFYAEQPLPIKITHNGHSTELIVSRVTEHNITLSPNQDHIITYEQLDNMHNNIFLHVKGIYLGKLNITEIIHQPGISEAVFKDTDNIFGAFVEELGEPDIQKLYFSNNFYITILKYIDLVKIDRL